MSRSFDSIACLMSEPISDGLILPDATTGEGLWFVVSSRWESIRYAIWLVIGWPVSEISACWIPFRHQTVPGITSLCVYFHSNSCDKALSLTGSEHVHAFQYDRPNFRRSRCRIFKSGLLTIIRYIEAHIHIVFKFDVLAFQQGYSIVIVCCYF